MAIWTLTINGVIQTVEAEPEMPLLWVLRDLLNLTGTKFGCGVGLCGACTILLDGEAVRSCLIPVSDGPEHALTTIEGLSTNGQPVVGQPVDGQPIVGQHPVQQAWLAEAVSQCGYCQPGQIMQAAALLASTPQVTDAEIDTAFAQHLCRCGTYLRIRRAIYRAANGS
jgi:aerobic-type carbon monoxide dehydrogenase small subunit (CoxS/CutS family)